MSDNSCEKSLNIGTISHIVFDLDGTLIDTELWGLNNANSVLAKYGKHCPLEHYSKLIGLDTLDRSQHLIDDFELNGYDKNSFREEWVKECMKTLTDIQLMPGVERLLDYLKKHDIPLAIATSGKRLETLAKTNHLSHIFGEGKYFQHIIHGDDQRVKRDKPFPVIYQICISEFKATPDPKNVLAFEDNSIGLSAAVSAGLTSVLANDNRFFDVKESKADLSLILFSH